MRDLIMRNRHSFDLNLKIGVLKYRDQLKSYCLWCKWSTSQTVDRYCPYGCGLLAPISKLELWKGIETL